MMSLKRIESDTHSRSSTSRGQTPASMTAWILSFVPSERYDSAQQASVRTSSSFEWIRRARAGRAGLVCQMLLNFFTKSEDKSLPVNIYNNEKIIIRKKK